ncbi:prepilin-type N-terminal cleavage/methylation domain-containing protein [Bacillus sp. FJAT-29790]|uniref:type IV pilus modification PilV family protein n=1 Tax=Bacillus sp. FJAT-29790 TaxID=1895002 RepID=UPI001C2442C7|nr:prepilin-type N-terminal cleavage/methylation domain-containing protein [Bacillus sp. FJAT-29790]MBU8879573.1 prepilin-type N-terminal cleavage/methylation domain-containing protein [Bacillus sp. FJAT-29790]
MNFRKILFNPKGFTLMEVLVSLTILGIILMGTMKFFSQAYTYTNINQKKTAAINVARNTLMYIEKDNFIAVRDRFEKDPEEEISLFICDEKYKKFWKNEIEDVGCEPITINNVKYEVYIRAEEKPEPGKKNYSFFVPLKATVTWTINGKDNSTVLDGVIKSEDLR